MLRNLFPLFIIILFFSPMASLCANNSIDELFSEGGILKAEMEIYDSFSEIDDVVEYIKEKEDITYTDMNASNLDYSLLSSRSALALNPDEENNKFQFTNQLAFFTGCVLGIPGIVIVAVINNGDSAIVKSSVWGCVTSGCVSFGGVAIFYIWYFYTFSTIYTWY